MERESGRHWYDIGFEKKREGRGLVGLSLPMSRYFLKTVFVATQCILYSSRKADFYNPQIRLYPIMHQTVL